jgi:DNA-binding NtrC family response regulator
MTDSPNSPYALVVDDNVLILLDACAMVREAGFRPLDACDVDAAIAHLERHTTDIALLFTDVQMPGGRDGFDLAREVAARWPTITILVASGLITPEPDQLPDGAVFIQKPFGADVVHQHLRDLLPDGRKPEPIRRMRG